MTERIEGIIDRLTDAEVFSDIGWILDAPVVNIALSVVDDVMQENIDFQYKAGLPAQVERILNDSKACRWCKQLAGKYTYPDVPDMLWHRHENCECIIKYIPAGGGRVDTLYGQRDLNKKRWYTDETEIAERKNYLGITKPTPSQLEMLKLYGIIEPD